MNGVTSATANVTVETDNVTSVWQYSSFVIAVTSVVISAVSVVGLLLNVLLVMTIQCSPSLKTPPNSHLLNICFNSLLLALHALLALPSLHLNGVHVPQKGSEVLSGLQLFLSMHCLLQYWGAFASIGYYRYKTIHHPSLSLRVRKLIVSRSITTTWVISLLLAMTFSLTSAHGSAYLPCTLDPFRSSFYLRVPEKVKREAKETGESWRQESEQVVVMSLVMVVLALGLVVILTSYYNICRTLNVAGRAGKSRIFPWPRHSTSLPTPSLPRLPSSEAAPTADKTAGGAVAPSGRSYRPDPDGQLFCVSGQRADSGQPTWIVHYQKCDHSDLIEDLLTLEKSGHTRKHNRSASAKRHVFANKRPLVATLSTGSTTSSGKTSNTKCPDFSDITLGGDIVRLQKLQCRSVLKEQSVRRERGSLSSASKNSIVMLTAYLLFSLPLIISQVPGSLEHLAPEQRVVALLVCRLLFLLNSPVYPLWYLLFSIRVKKCLTRMCETLLVRFQYRQQ